ncbi:hypothetical protein, partial [Streptomyces sp. Agncl-13]|uniref:hypothetical protein n=1 Tax=Streptomyces sp. Agncl-13 TaxID=3400628 RepID=UPI003A889E8B
MNLFNRAAPSHAAAALQACQKLMVTSFEASSEAPDEDWPVQAVALAATSGWAVRPRRRLRRRAPVPPRPADA